MYEQLDLIQKLKDSEEIKRKVSEKDIPSGSDNKHPVPTYASKLGHQRNVTRKNLITANLKNKHSEQDSNANKLELKQKEKMSELVNLNNDIIQDTNPPSSSYCEKSNHHDFKTVTHKKRRNGTTLGTNTEKCEISAVESRRSMFISRLAPDTTVDKLQKHLLQYNITSLSIEKLKIQSSDIAAFKIVTTVSMEKSINNPEIWPRFTILRPFREQRKLSA